MVGVGGKLVEVNPHRSVVGARLAEICQFLARGEYVARSNHRESIAEVAIERGIDAVVVASGDVDDWHEQLLSLDLHQPELAPDVTCACFAVGLTTHQQMHLEMAGESLEPRRKIDSIADDRIVEALFAA